MICIRLPVDVGPGAVRAWVHACVLRLEQEAARSADTHLLHLDLPAHPGIDLYLKDEAAHPSGSLKHRLARSLFLYALCNGRLGPGQAAIDASSGSTAISEAWFARLLGVRFIAVMPRGTAPGKLRELQALGAECDLIDATASGCEHAQRRALTEGLCYLDQFGLAERATDWRGNNNIAESLLAQLRLESEAVPRWIICGAGTGGTSATIGRYLRYRRLDTQLCVAEPEGGAFAAGWIRGDRDARASGTSLIEGIGRERVEPGFLFDIVDRVIEVSDAASCAGIDALERRLGRRYGGSSGTSFIAALQLADELQARGERGSLVMLLCDRGERYAETLYDRSWRATHGLDPSAHARWIETRIDGTRVPSGSGRGTSAAARPDPGRPR